jgi:hypothetical protein
MGYSLVFYSLDWDTLSQELVVQRPGHMAGIRQSEWEQLHEHQAPEKVEAAWRHACKEVSRFLTPGPLRPPLPVTVDEEAALLFVAHVRHFGIGLGELDHASASGQEFLAEFLANVAARYFEIPKLMEWLTDRPVAELRSEVLPSWGGIRRSELLQMTRACKRRQDGPPDSSENCDIWLEELTLLLQDAELNQRDVVTLYL